VVGTGEPESLSLSCHLLFQGQRKKKKDSRKAKVHDQLPLCEPCGGLDWQTEAADAGGRMLYITLFAGRRGSQDLKRGGEAFGDAGATTKDSPKTLSNFCLWRESNRVTPAGQKEKKTAKNFSQQSTKPDLDISQKDRYSYKDLFVRGGNKGRSRSGGSKSLHNPGSRRDEKWHLCKKSARKRTPFNAGKL